jgi:membrane protein implicated in regulation of membrane protease activity
VTTHLRGGQRGTRRPTVALVAVSGVVVALHLGLGAAVIAAHPWTGWALDIVLTAVAVKLLASIVVGRRIVAHRRRSSATRTDRPQRPRASRRGSPTADDS